MQFHDIHGSNVALLQSKRIARRENLGCSDALTFTDRPLQINEKIFIKFIGTSWGVSFGYTSHNPSTLKNRLPKYAFPVLIYQKGFWVRDVVNHKTDKNFIIYFYVNERGTVIYSIDGLTEEVLLHGVKTDCTLWAMIDLYGNSKLVELVKTELKTDIIPHPKAEFNSNFTLTTATNVRSPFEHNMSAECPLLVQVEDDFREDELHVFNECVVCYEKPANTVVYACGHICLCYPCAFNIWQGRGNGRCPICRNIIRNII
ncbi:hypothetical protein PGB90_006877 [Kerria lacca]